MKSLHTPCLLIGAFVFLVVGMGSACTTKESAPPAPAQVAPVSHAASPKEVISAGTKPDTVLEIATDGDNMNFNKSELTAKTGTVVQLKFTNESKTAGLQHNWVLVQPGQEASVSNAGTSAGDSSDWINSNDSNIIAHTKLLRTGGETDTILFRAPPSGDYPFICTFPGHYLAMKGVFHSKP